MRVAAKRESIKAGRRSGPPVSSGRHPGSPRPSPAKARAGQTVTRRRRTAEENLDHVQRLVMQGELAATAVHEISNLQTIVLLNAGLLREAQKDNPAVTRYVDPLLHAAGLVATLCSQLRNLAHPGEGEPRRVDLRETAQATYQLLEQIMGRELAFEDVSGRPLPVWADPGHLDQMLINLVLNARDATPEERGRIAVRVGALSGGRSFLEVADNGTGMTPAVRANLFRKFFTTKQRGRGTGLGLSTVHRLLQGMGGRIEVRSRVGQGTRLRLVFPRVSPAA
jgi:two-component system cell cycle sensor histidine kinase/response regulator CckA